jgi:hypothetical protein
MFRRHRDDLKVLDGRPAWKDTTDHHLDPPPLIGTAEAKQEYAMFGKTKIGKPTNVQMSGTSRFTSAIAGGLLDERTKGFLLAGLASVGVYSHGKVYSSAEFHNWKQGSGDICIPANEKGLNCWTAVLFWAFQGGGLSAEDMTRYQHELRQCVVDDTSATVNAQNPVMYSMLRANQVVDINEDSEPPAGVTIFFGDTPWKRPMNHVVASLGGGYVVSCASLFMAVKPRVVEATALLNPSIPYDALTKGLNHISTIKLIADSDPTPRIRATTRPFWELPRIPWAG